MANPEEMILAGFLVALGRRIRGRTVIASEFELRNPLNAILDRIRHSPATVEHKLLLRILHALTSPTTEETERFSSANVAALSLSASQLLSALVDDLMSGRYRRDDIRTALLIQPISQNSDIGGGPG